MKRTLGLFGSVILGGSLLATGCSGGDSGNGEVTTAHGDYHKFALSRLLVPQKKTDYSIDLNGDGKVDNQLGAIIGALMGNGLDTQGAIDKAVLEGTIVLLVSVQSTDATLTTDDAAGVNVYLGKTTTNPDFGGSGMFTVDTAQAPAQFLGKLAGGKFSSNNPVTTKTPVKVTVELPLIDNAAPVPLNLNGAHITFQSAACAADPSGMATLDGGTSPVATPKYCGQLQGSICNKDVQSKIIPGVAATLTKKIQADPNGSSTAQIKSLFDTGDNNGGNCTGVDGVVGKPNDGIIAACEVAGNQIVMGVLAPDVQIFTDETCMTYMPNAANTKKDSLSLGLAFDLVGANFSM